jgi:hypothetical protein
MRGQRDRRLPIVVPLHAETADEFISCATCDAGYKAVAGALGHLNGKVYWKRRRQAEHEHNHFLHSGYPADKRLVWEQHCERCHMAGEAI